jgi:hypothetical protein
MAFEEMGDTTRPCHCGKGTITLHMQSDDWGRYRSYTTYQCSICRAKAVKEEREQLKREKQRAALLNRATRIAERRYLDRWLSRFASKNKKEAWLLCTGGRNPSLGTFYKNTKKEGLEKYLRDHFSLHFQDVLSKMKVKDKDIQKLLVARDRIEQLVQTNIVTAHRA